ncbi:hypothetical protein EB796_004284 [Bugula neritina]|uniref:Uncharacterized protein n=1 Tax=Bugula neritina TaxID=10212 RepID=A0A7J7IWT9_BUGNE|nr:hypothetical protein EB796_023687 [Bugula neritina]KAF6037410.1 hypothetical protein EB796_004284 [Bugula neritina]
MLTLNNRVHLLTATGRNNHTTFSPGRIDLIALSQILPPTCCVLKENSPANQEVQTAYLPSNFSKLELVDYSCPHTGDVSNSQQGCYNEFKTLYDRNIYGVIGGGSAGVFVLLVTVFFAFKLGTYPTTEEWSLMQAQEQEAVYGVNASSTYDSSVYDPTYAEPQYWDVAEDAAYQPTFESTHSSSGRSKKRKRKKRKRRR